MVPRLASFEGWSDTVRSALIWLGRADPVMTMERTRAEDSSVLSLSQMLSAWSDVVGTGKERAKRAAEIIKMSEEPGDQLNDWRWPDRRNAISEAIASRGKISAKRLGNWLSSYRGRIVNGLRFAGEGDEHGHGIRWWVERC
jgi:putative DNA primase/helicase